MAARGAGGGGGGGGGGRSVSGHHQPFDAAAAETNEVTEGLRELLANLEPLIKSSGSSANLGGMLGYLEENDDEFKRYQLVEWARNHLEASVRALVEEEVGLQCRRTELTPHKMKMVAPAILHKVLRSAEMKDCLARMQMQVADASWEMARDIESEYVKISANALKMNRVTGGAFPSGGDGLMLGATAASVFGGGDFNANQENHFRAGSSASRPFYDRTDSGNDSLGSSWNNSNFVFLQPHQYARLAERLNKFGPPDDKLEALGTLLSTQMADVVGSPSWSSVSEGLQAAVLDQNLNVSSLGRRVYSRLVSNISPFATKEAFVSLLGSVTSVYADKTRAHLLPTAASGVLFKKKFHQNLIQAVELISLVACDLPKYWTRYPEKYVDQMALAFIHFLNHSVVGAGGGGGGGGAGFAKSRSTQQAPLSPLQILSLVDNRARWLKHWLHGNLGRSRFFRHLEALSGGGDGREFPGNLARAVVAVLENRPVEEWTLTRASFRNSAKGKGSVSDSLISYGFFLHSVRVICSMLGYERGSRLIPNGQGWDLVNKGFLGFMVIAALVFYVLCCNIPCLSYYQHFLKHLLTFIHILAHRQRHGAVRLSQRPCFNTGAREGRGLVPDVSGESSTRQMVFGRRNPEETITTIEGLVQGRRVGGRLEAVSGKSG